MTRRDGRPRHEQIAADLRARILSGEIPPGERLPSTQQLVDRYTAANATIQNALTALKNERLVRSEPGKGVYARDRQSFVVRAGAYFTPSPGGYSYRLLDVTETQPPGEVAVALGLAGEATAVLRRRLMLHNGEPVELSWSYYPGNIASGTPIASRSKISGGVPRILADLGYPPHRFEDRLSARAPTTEELEGLDLPDDVPVIRQFRVIYTESDRPVEVSVLIKGSHLYELEYRETVTGD